MKRILSLLVTSAAFALCSCQSTMQSDIKATGGDACKGGTCKAGAACCPTGSAARKTDCATCTTGAKHKH